MDKDTQAFKLLADNRRARHEYSVDDRIECGMELRGTEVKSFKAGLFSFPDAYAEIVEGQAWLNNLLVTEYAYSSIFNHDPRRKKRLLLHKAEIRRLGKKVVEKGYTLIPLKFYLKGRVVKVELGLCKGKKLYDKRNDIKEREVARDISREMRKQNQ